MKYKNTYAISLTLVILLILSSSLISANNYHMTLLTVGEAGEIIVGGTADAYLEIKPGEGRIFLDSFPLTKLDTQISTRYANQIACDYLDADCSNFDFFYTIRASSSVVGGPSASAPLTILTIAALEGVQLKNDTVMTGTINSGGSIGPVGGVFQKALAAQNAGFRRVLVPKLSIEDELEKNQSNNKTPTTWEDKIRQINEENDGIYDIIEIGKNTSKEDLTIEVIEISNLEDAIAYFTDEIPPMEYPEISAPEDYKRIMMDVSLGLCEKAISLKEDVNLTGFELNRTIELENKSRASFESGNYYSAASFCFNMGVMLRRISLAEIEDKNPEQLEAIRRKTLRAVNEFDENIEKINITTIPNLESYIIVKERLIESDTELREIRGNISSDRLAYAIERYYSAVAWSKFFQMSGKTISLDQIHLQEACSRKILEAEERINYADLYLPELTDSASENLGEAYYNRQTENYEMCLFKASFAKSEANLLLSSVAIGTDKLSELSGEKISSAEKLIAKEGAQGFFPIMGYSYYEYAKSLHENGDELSALIFSEYALELSNLEMYFPKEQKSSFSLNIRPELWAALACTLILGFTLGSATAIFFIRKNIARPALPVPKQKQKKKTRR